MICFLHVFIFPLQKCGVEFNTDPLNAAQNGNIFVICSDFLKTV